MLGYLIESWLWRVEMRRRAPHPYWPLTAKYIRPAKVSRRKRPAWQRSE